MTLHPYIVHDGDPSAGAVLAFAQNAQEARILGFELIRGWHTECRFIDVRARQLHKHRDWLYQQMTSSEPHALDDPPTCPTCEHWGAPLLPGGAGCLDCADVHELARKATLWSVIEHGPTQGMLRSFDTAHTDKYTGRGILLELWDGFVAAIRAEVLVTDPAHNAYSKD